MLAASFLVLATSLASICDAKKFVLHKMVPWSEAEQACRNVRQYPGSKLAIISLDNIKQVQDAVATLKDPKDRLWIGGVANEPLNHVAQAIGSYSEEHPEAVVLEISTNVDNPRRYRVFCQNGEEESTVSSKHSTANATTDANSASFISTPDSSAVSMTAPRVSSAFATSTTDGVKVAKPSRRTRLDIESDGSTDESDSESSESEENQKEKKKKKTRKGSSSKHHHKKHSGKRDGDKKDGDKKGNKKPHKHH